MKNTIQLYTDESKTVKGYPITSPDRVLYGDGKSIKDKLKKTVKFDVVGEGENIPPIEGELDKIKESVDSINEQLDKIEDNIAKIFINAKNLGFTTNINIDNYIYLKNIKENSIIQFGSGEYNFNNISYIEMPNNVELKGNGETIFLLDTTNPFLSFVNKKNIKINGITFKDKNYIDDIFFSEENLPLPNFTTTSLDISTNSKIVTLTTSSDANQGSIYHYEYTFNIDSNKEYMIQMYDGFFNNSTITDQINIIRTFTNGTTQTDLLNLQVSQKGNQGQWRWLSNYIPRGVKQITLQIPVIYHYNTTKPTYILDFSKLKLFKAVKELPNSVDTNCMRICGCENVEIKNNEFHFFEITPLGISGKQFINVNYQVNNNKFINCFNQHCDMSSSNNSCFRDNYIYRAFYSDNGERVHYGKTSSRALTGSYSQNLKFINNIIDGTYFGSEIHDTKNLLISGNIQNNTMWGHSLVNGCTGIVNNEIINMIYGWRHGIEQATDSLMNISNIKISGKTHHGVAFSNTDNKAGSVTIDNINIEQCLVFTQYTHNPPILSNINITNCSGCFSLVIGNNDLSQKDYKINNCTFNNIDKCVSYSFLSGFIVTDKLHNYISLNNITILGDYPKSCIILKSNNFYINNLIQEGNLTYRNELTNNTTSINCISVVENSKINKLHVTDNKIYNTNINSKFIIRNCVLLNKNIGSNVIKENII